MIFILSKLLLFLLMPLVWAIALFLFALFSKNSTKRKKLLISGVIILLVFSNSFLVGKIYNLYEPKYAEIKHYDVGIVLGGFSNINKRNGQIAFGFTSDRLLQAIALFKQGIINKVLIASGNANIIDKKVKEADLAKDYLRKIGIPDSVIMIENRSRNTLENAKFSRELINSKAKVLVITSAWHTPRAKLNFDKYFKNDIAYYPTNHIGKVEYDLSDFIIPSAGALSDWNIILKEWMGLLIDSFRN